jgi:osmotically inducible lipoprotein OsmB
MKSNKEDIQMKTMNRSVVSAAVVVMMLVMSGCGNMSTRDKNTAVGAGAGAVAGAVLTGGSAVGTVGGAAVGGLIGNQVGK